MTCPKCGVMLYEVRRLATLTLLLRRRECSTCGYWTITQALGPEAPEEELDPRIVERLRAYYRKVCGRLRAENPGKSRGHSTLNTDGERLEVARGN